MKDPIVEKLFSFADRCQPQISSHTLCIYAWQKQNRKLAVLGTGVLLRVADRHFLVSAAHVLDHAFNLRMPIAAVPGSGDDKTIPLDFVGRLSSDPASGVGPNNRGVRDDDPVDLSVAEFKPETAAKLAAGRRFLSLCDFDPSPLPERDGAFLIFGYPHAMAQPGKGDVHLENWPLPYLTFPVRDSLQTNDVSGRILFQFYRHGNDGNGLAVQVPEPFGLSGSGIWRIARAPIDIGSLNTADIRLVGIQHGWRRTSNSIVGTSVIRVCEFLSRGYPDLRPALAMYRPD